MADQTAPTERDGAPRAAARNGPAGAVARRPRGAQRDGAHRLRRATSGSATSPASCKLPKSTLHRICAILVERGWALRDEGGRYEPGVRAIGLGSRAAEPADRHRLPPRRRRPHDPPRRDRLPRGRRRRRVGLRRDRGDDAAGAPADLGRPPRAGVRVRERAGAPRRPLARGGRGRVRRARRS